MNRRMLLLTLSVLCFLLTMACSPASLIGKTDIGRYVSDVREPLSRFGSWAQDVLAFYQDTLRLQTINGACASGRLQELIKEGEAVVADLKAIKPPSAIASTHDGVVKTGQEILENLRQVHTLLCENRDLAGAKRMVEDADATFGQLLERLDTLKRWLQER